MLHNEERRTARRTRVTKLQFYSYQLAIREGFSLLHSSGKLFQQYIVYRYLKVDENWLQFIKSNQSRLRCDSYLGLMDHVNNVAEDNNVAPGGIIIVPSTFIGSPRNMQQNYQDAMATVWIFGIPDLFITFTCNPRWPEILENVAAWQQVKNCPNLVTRYG